MYTRQFVVFLLLAAFPEGFFLAGSNITDINSVTWTTRQENMRRIDETLQSYRLCVNIFGRTISDPKTALYVLHGIRLPFAGWMVNATLYDTVRFTELEKHGEVVIVYNLCRMLEKECLKEDLNFHQKLFCRDAANLVQQIVEGTVDRDTDETSSVMDEEAAGTNKSSRPNSDAHIKKIIPLKPISKRAQVVLILFFNFILFLLILIWKIGRRCLPATYVLFLISCLLFVAVYHYCIATGSGKLYVIRK